MPLQEVNQQDAVDAGHVNNRVTRLEKVSLLLSAAALLAIGYGAKSLGQKMELNDKIETIKKIDTGNAVVECRAGGGKVVQLATKDFSVETLKKFAIGPVRIKTCHVQPAYLPEARPGR